MRTRPFTISVETPVRTNRTPSGTSAPTLSGGGSRVCSGPPQPLIKTEDSAVIVRSPGLLRRGGGRTVSGVLLVVQIETRSNFYRVTGGTSPMAPTERTEV